MGRHHHNALVSTELFYLLWFYLLWQVMGRHAMLWLLPIEGAGPTVDAARWEAPSWEAPSWERHSSPRLPPGAGTVGSG